MIEATNQYNQSLQDQWTELKLIDQYWRDKLEKIKDYQESVEEYYQSLRSKHQVLCKDYEMKAEQLVQHRERLVGLINISEACCLIKPEKNRFEDLLKDYYAISNQVAVSELTLEIGQYHQKFIFKNLIKELKVYQDALVAKW